MPDKEKTLEASQEKVGSMQASVLFSKFFSTSYLAIACLDRDFSFLRVNPAYARVYGKTPEFFLGKGYFDLFPDEALREGFSMVLATGEPYVVQAVPFVTMDGEVQTMTWWDWHVNTMVDRSNRPEGLLICLLDVSARVMLERKIVSVTDEEQKRLGQELHDGLGQLLTGISLKVKVLEEIILEKDPQVVPQVQEVGHLIREATVQARDLSKLLNPIIVQTQGLVPALECLAAETRGHAVRCRFTWDSPVEHLAPVVALHLYRIAQESVTNALRHGPATDIAITFAKEPAGRALRIENDGVPFDADDVEESDGLGVRGMRYRAGMIGATFAIKPGPQGGTVVRCLLPTPEVALDVGSSEA